MSQTAEGAEPSVPRKALRTVTPGSKTRPDAEMDSIGWAVFLGLVILLIPIVPFIAVVWGVSTLLEFLARQREE